MSENIQNPKLRDLRMHIESVVRAVCNVGVEFDQIGPSIKTWMWVEENLSENSIQRIRDLGIVWYGLELLLSHKVSTNLSPPNGFGADWHQYKPVFEMFLESVKELLRREITGDLMGNMSVPW